MVEKLFYSMGEVAEMFDVNTSLIRHWESQFTVLKPKRNKKGNRMFTPADVDNLKQIYHLVKERGMTLEGAKKAMREIGRGESKQPDVELVERLQNIRAMLVKVKTELDDNDRFAASTSMPTSRARRRAQVAQESQDKELFAFYEQSLF